MIRLKCVRVNIVETTHERWLCVVPSVRRSATDGRRVRPP